MAEEGRDDPVQSESAPAASQPARPGEETPEALKARLDETKAEAERYLNNWRRAEADLANYKRRAEQERDEQRRFANAALIINILPVLDDLERALASVDARLAGLTWFDGVRLIHRKLQLVLENAGVSAIETEGQAFDPRCHEAVTYAEGEEGKVVAEVQRGYRLYDRVLRPAMVIVGKAKTEEEGKGKKEEGDETKEDQPT